MIPQPVYVVERPDLRNLPTFLEAIGLALWLFFGTRHHIHEVFAGLLGLGAFWTWMMLHGLKGWFWVVAVPGVLMWALCGYLIADAAWPGDHVWMVTCTLLAAAFSLGEKRLLFERLNRPPGSE